MTLRFELLAECGCATILPNDCFVDGLAGCAVPYDGGFALIGDANRGYITSLQVGFGQGFPGHRYLRCRDLLRVVLDPSRLGEELGELGLGHGDDGAAIVKQQSSRTGCALIE